ncbi:MAG: hypothetical protein JXR63_07685 [Spirochaetales bacterium]|nr:hypothetical protein [Spirochaetales bacterium]
MNYRCLNKRCKNNENPEGSWYIKKGYYRNKFGKVQRFSCKECGKGFSESTFSFNYYSHLRLDAVEIMKMVSVGNSMRFIALHNKVSCNAILSIIKKISRNCLAVHCELQENLHLREDLAADGLENFVKSKYYPCDYNILVGQESQYLYGFSWSLMRRKGTMTDAQKARFKKLQIGVDYKNFTITRGFQSLTRLMISLLNTKQHFDENKILTVFDTDEKKQYANVIKQARKIQEYMKKNEFRHDVTNSKEPRTAKNRLFPVNYMEREARKDLKEMVRKTTCGAKNVCMSLDRFNLFAVYHNTQKKFRINDSVSGSWLRHAHFAGLDPVLTMRNYKRIFSERFFFSDFEKRFSDFQKKMWLRRIPTPQDCSKEYLPKYALL